MKQPTKIMSDHTSDDNCQISIDYRFQMATTEWLCKLEEVFVFGFLFGHVNYFKIFIISCFLPSRKILAGTMFLKLPH
jgi:hypothetical protein